MTGVAPARYMGTAWRCQHRSRAVLRHGDWKSIQCRALTALWKSQLTDYLILFTHSLASCPLPRAFASSDETGGEKDGFCPGPAACCAVPWLTAERAERTEAAVWEQQWLPSKSCAWAQLGQNPLELGHKQGLHGCSPTALARHLDCLFAVGFQGLRWSLKKLFRHPGWYKKRQLSKKLLLVHWEWMMLGVDDVPGGNMHGPQCALTAQLSTCPNGSFLEAPLLEMSCRGAVGSGSCGGTRKK